MTICIAKNGPELSRVGRELAPAVNQTELTETGEIVREQLLALETFYDNVKIDRYVIMPDHIHAIIVLTGKAAGASSRPTLMQIVQSFKSKATRICNQKDDTPGRKIFQTSFYDEIIKNKKAYEEVSRYIYNNPMKSFFEKV